MQYKFVLITEHYRAAQGARYTADTIKVNAICYEEALVEAVTKYPHLRIYPYAEKSDDKQEKRLSHLESLIKRLIDILKIKLVDDKDSMR